jgi:hypothetical protein
MLTDSLVDQGGVSWGYDGYIYYDGHLEGDGVARIRATGGKPEIFTRPNHDSGEAYHNYPFALPGGRGVLFSIRGGSGAAGLWNVGVADTRTGKYTVLTRGISPLYSPTGHLLYLTETGVLMAAPFDLRRMRISGEAVEAANGVALRAGTGRSDVALSREGTLVYSAGGSSSQLTELVWVTRGGAATPVDPTWRAAFQRPALSPDGRTIAVALGAPTTDVWIKRIGGGPPTRITFDGRSISPAWTPDGRRVVFATGPVGVRTSLMVVPADGSGLPRALRQDSGGIALPLVSHDGAWLVYQSRSDLFGVRMAGDSTRRTLVSSPFTDATPALSPDGRWLAYMSDESGGFEVYVRPFPETQVAKWQVSNGGGLFPVWSRSGRELIYQSSRGDLMMAPVLPGRAFATGDHRVLFPLVGYTGAAFDYASYDPAPDGQRFLMVRRIGAEQRDQLVVVENFFDVLRGRAR